MKRNPIASRAARLLRWYPKTWRARYGEEFAAHLEQEYADRPRHLIRTANVIYKGIVARFADAGLAGAYSRAEGNPQAATGAGFVLATVVGFVALAFWSQAMTLWNGPSRASVANTWATGAMTVATGAIVIVLGAVALTVIVLSIRRVVQGRHRSLVGPLCVAVVSGSLVLYNIRFAPRKMYSYFRGAHGFSGIRLNQPGRLIKALAETAWGYTDRWIALWNEGAFTPTKLQAVVDYLTPVALIAFAVAIALLLRRLELPRRFDLASRKVPVVLGGFAATFLVACFVWLAAGGQKYVQPFAPEGRGAAVAYLSAVGLSLVLMFRSIQLAWRGGRARRDPVRG